MSPYNWHECADDSSCFDPVEPRGRHHLPEQAECKHCNEVKLAADMSSTFPNLGWNVCITCESRLHPMCACGCKQPAKLVADIRWPGGVDCRAPWVDIEHALASVTDHTTDRPSIDVVVDAQSLPALLSLVPIDQSPCWCNMEAMSCFHGYEYHTRLTWCPKHGQKE